MARRPCGSGQAGTSRASSAVRWRQRDQRRPRRSATRARRSGRSRPVSRDARRSNARPRSGTLGDRSTRSPATVLAYRCRRACAVSTHRHAAATLGSRRPAPASGGVRASRAAGAGRARDGRDASSVSGCAGPAQQDELAAATVHEVPVLLDVRLAGRAHRRPGFSPVLTTAHGRAYRPRGPAGQRSVTDVADGRQPAAGRSGPGDRRRRRPARPGTPAERVIGSSGHRRRGCRPARRARAAVIAAARFVAGLTGTDRASVHRPPHRRVVGGSIRCRVVVGRTVGGRDDRDPTSTRSDTTHGHHRSNRRPGDPRLAGQPDGRGRGRARRRHDRAAPRCRPAPPPARSRRSSCATATRTATWARASRRRSPTSRTRSPTS